MMLEAARSDIDPCILRYSVSAGIAIRWLMKISISPVSCGTLCATQLAIKEVSSVVSFHDFYSTLVGMGFL